MASSAIFTNGASLSASTKTQALRSRVALEAKLTNGKSIVLPKSGSAELNVAGTIIRNGINAVVRVSIDGLPKGITVAPFNLPADQSEFKTTFSIPVNAELLKLTKLSVGISVQFMIQETNLMAPAIKETESHFCSD